MALCRSCQGSLPSLSCWKGAAVAATADGAQLKPRPVVPQTIQTIHSNRLPKHAALLGRCPAQPARSTARKVRAVLLVLLRVHDCNTPQIKVLITPHLIERLVWCWLEHKQSCDLALPATRKLSSAVQTVRRCTWLRLLQQASYEQLGALFRQLQPVRSVCLQAASDR